MRSTFLFLCLSMCLQLIRLYHARIVNVAGFDYEFPITLALLYEGYCNSTAHDCENVLNDNINTDLLYAVSLALADIKNNPALRVLHGTKVDVRNTEGLAAISLQ